MTMTPEKAQALLDQYEQASFAGIVSVDYMSGFLRAYIAQAKQIEAARVLAGEVGRVANLLLCSGSNTAMTVALVAALAAYEEIKK